MNGRDAAAQFRWMADRIERNADEFAGAFIVIPPGEGDTVVEGLAVAVVPNAAAFWSSAMGQVEVAVEAFRTSNEPGGGARRGYR